jgi:PAS domain S-box-containing protein
MIQSNQTSGRSEPAQGQARGAGLRAPPALMTRADMELAAALDFDAALRALASIVIPAAADWFAVDLVNESGGLERVAIEHQDPVKVEEVRALEREYPRPTDAAYGPAEVVRTGRSELVPEITDELLRGIARDERHLELLQRLELSSYLVTPLTARGRTVGTLTFVFAESGRRYDEDARLFLEDLSSRAALTLANIRLIEELETARRRAEAHLARVEEEHREKEALLASTADGIYGLDQEGRCTFLNPAAARMLQLEPGQVQGRRLHPLIHHSRPDGRPYPESDCPIYGAVRKGESVRGSNEILWRADGSWFPISYSSSPMTRDGEVVGAVVAFTDESPRRSAEHRVQLLGRILDQSLNEIYIFDAATLRFVQVNRGARENLGYHMDELREMTPLDLKPDVSDDDFAALIEPLQDGSREAVRFETVHRRKDGSLYPVEVNLQLSASEQGRLFVAVILDISDRRAAEEERERLIQDLERANSIKGDFVSTMSHELRTPLNAIIGYAQLLEDGVPQAIPEAALAHVRRIDLSAHHLLQLIDEILTFSKLEAGRESVALAPVMISELVAEVRAVLDPMATAKGLDFDVRTEGAPPQLLSDPKKLRQILLNLAGNAVKFTDEGRVRLRVEGRGEQIAFTVSDTGIGMDAEAQRRMFEPFWQADQSSTREVGGTGLGLAITRRFVDVLDGTLDVESTPGAGTTFTVALPLDPETKKAIP